MLAKFAKSVEGGLGNSNEDEGRGSFPEVPMSAPASIYEKQQSWRMNSLSKVAKLKEDEQKSALEGMSFEPTIYSVPVKTFEGTAKDLSVKFGNKHIERQSRARKEKAEREAAKLARSAINGIKSVSASNSRRSSVASISDVRSSSANPIIGFEDNGFTVGNSASSSSSAITVNKMTNREAARDLTQPSGDSQSEAESIGDEDEQLLELLEHERKEWDDERAKLIQCIHLQQIELSQRSTAAHERAVDIAKEFARVIEGFEERIVAIEDSFQKEIVAIKNIADALLKSQSSK